MFSSYSRASR